MASQSTLFLRNMPTDIVREAKATAARRGTTLARVVADALTKSRDVAPDALREELALERAIRWYERNRPSLVRRFSGRYVAIEGGRIIDTDRDFEALAERVFRRGGARSVFMPRVEAAPRTVHLRSPRRA